MRLILAQLYCTAGRTAGAGMHSRMPALVMHVVLPVIKYDSVY